MRLNENACKGFDSWRPVNEASVLIRPYKLLCIHVRGIRKTFLFNLHIFTTGATNRAVVEDLVD